MHIRGLRHLPAAMTAVAFISTGQRAYGQG